MIKVDRGIQPPVLAKRAARWRTDLAATVDPAHRRRLLDRYQHPQVKEALERDFHGKCAYCESKISHVSYGHIEHYRPKGGLRGQPDLAFDWNNLFLACGRCNGPEHKGDRFPHKVEGGPIVNPCDDEPAEHFHFEFDPVAKIASVFGTTTRGKTTEALLGLNRYDLRTHRSRVVERLAALARFATLDTEAARLLADARLSSSEYAAFARALQSD